MPDTNRPVPEVYNIYMLVDNFGPAVLDLPNYLIQDFMEILIAKTKANRQLDSMKDV